MSSNQNTKSSAENGAPSDHFMPARSVTRVVLPSSLITTLLAIDGMILLPV